MKLLCWRTKDMAAYVMGVVFPDTVSLKSAFPLWTGLFQEFANLNNYHLRCWWIQSLNFKPSKHGIYIYYLICIRGLCNKSAELAVRKIDETLFDNETDIVLFRLSSSSECSLVIAIWLIKHCHTTQCIMWNEWSLKRICKHIWI